MTNFIYFVLNCTFSEVVLTGIINKVGRVYHRMVSPEHCIWVRASLAWRWVTSVVEAVTPHGSQQGRKWEEEETRLLAGAENTEVHGDTVFRPSVPVSPPPPKHFLLCNNTLKPYNEFTWLTDEDIKTLAKRSQFPNWQIWDLNLWLSNDCILHQCWWLGDARRYSFSSMKSIYCKYFSSFDTKSNA